MAANGKLATVFYYKTIRSALATYIKRGQLAISHPM